MENKKAPKESKASRVGENEYLNREEFIKEMAKVVAAYPYFAPTELTWEVYWNDLHWIPKENLTRGLAQCRLTCTFFPTVADIVKSSIGGEFRAVPYNPHKPTTLPDIIQSFKTHFKMAALVGRQLQNQLPDADSLLKKAQGGEEEE